MLNSARSSSAISELCFSNAGYTINVRRTRLNPNNVNTSYLLYKRLRQLGMTTFFSQEETDDIVDSWKLTLKGLDRLFAALQAI